MELSEQGLRLRGCLRLALKNAFTGEIQRIIENPNIAARVGIAWMLQHMLSGQGATSQVLSHLALGTATVAPASSDTGLGSELVRKAVATFDTAGLTATDKPYFQALVDFATNEANGTLAEIGLFNSSAAGTMLVHGSFATLGKTTSQTLGATYTVSGNVT